MVALKKPLFKLGQVLATPGAIEVLEKAGQQASELLSRHVVGDWGVLCDEDKAANDQALKDGSRLLSAYILKDAGQTKVWIITEAEDDAGKRACSTILLPTEY